MSGFDRRTEAGRGAASYPERIFRRASAHLAAVATDRGVDVELANRAFEDKVVGFACSAGGMRSYMSVMALANHLMLDFRSVIVLRYVYVKTDEWTAEGAPTADVDRRLKRSCDDLERISVGPATEA